ncbi:polymeric immunoglobulin receptor-like isoform X1 [Xyrauchen texanus]|uniref:polymeric immunoglobulin receptor-like isoform X1 n=1 Tax=Xyrauchen texanus TaxID=154827 RepID=UPI00224214D1|nr:polymeric immunoglobulin receptor-like isoform X1 [Xyrauchen texanus]
MMKILLFFTILIMGHVGGATDTGIGITGGGVIILFKYPENTKESVKRFCKVSDDECTTLATPQDHLWIPEERFSMTDNMTLKFINVLIRNLTINDTGQYKCKVGNTWSEDVTLNVQQEPYSGTSKGPSSYLRGTVKIRCKYPEKYKDFLKNLYKVHNRSLHSVIAAFGVSHTQGRYSLIVDSQENVFTVTIINVNRGDEGIYFCGICNSSGTVCTSSLLTEVHLHVTDFSVIITVCVCLTLLLAGVLSLLLLFKRRCNKNEGSIPSSHQTSTRESDEAAASVYYETIKDSDVKSRTLNSSAQSPASLNMVYSTADLPKRPSDRDFYTLAELPKTSKP